MKITVLAVGKMKNDGGFCEMETFYLERIRRFVQAEVCEVKEKRTVDEETALLYAKIPKSVFKIALREEGKQLSSMKFAELIRNKRDAASDIVFIIGGAYGLGNVQEDMSLSMAPWTLPHQLARISLLEQLYRAFTIISGSKYHHD